MPHQQIDIASPDGVKDSRLYWPEGPGPWPAVIMYTDIMGSRPVFEAMAARLSQSGFVVLLPNQFYRLGG